MSNRRNKGLNSIIWVWILVMIAVGQNGLLKEAKAAETSTVRVISTTDIHEQLTDECYDVAGTHKKGSLAQAFTLIKEARAEIATGTSVTVDCGDTIYGYAGHYLAEKFSDSLNYMFKAFGEIGYDCITMGNHDFDMGIDYLREQLNLAGLNDICVCANVYDAITKKPIWQQNKIVKKTILTSKGREVTIKIGFVGVTRPALSNFYSHKGILTTTDILSEAKMQAKALKDAGADIVVAVAHSGIGTDSPDELSTDTCYALSKLKNVDVVMGGHIHVNFPSTSASVQKYYELDNVDQETGLMNGKSVIIVEDRGAGIGVADLQIRITKTGKVKIDSRSSEIRYISADTPYDEAITQYKSEFDPVLKSTYSEGIVPLAEGEELNNYFAALEDNDAMQIINESKIQFGLNYTNGNVDTQAYKDLPVIAVSAFMNSGNESGSDYLHATSNITMADLLRMQSYGGNFTTVYKITGAQLKEWLEWAASGYQQMGTLDANYADEYILGAQSLYPPLLKTDWMTNWQHMYTFDGVEYTIDISKPARYDYYGNYISTGNRIKTVTCNGVPVTDSQEFLLVCDLMTTNPIIGGVWTTDCKIERTDTRSYSLVSDYLKYLASFGSISVKADNNWRLSVPSTSSFIFKTGIGSMNIAKNQSWYRDTLYANDQYAYYRVSINEKDMTGPTLVLNQEIKITTHRDVPIRIQATDSSGIAGLQFLKGQYLADSPQWEKAQTITGNRFYADENGIYTVRAVDGKGNSTVKYININVINRSVLQVPSVDKLNNRINQISGITEAGAAVYLIDQDGKTYSTYADSTGAYTMDIDYLPGDSTVKLYTQDSLNRKSAYETLTVKRTGSNFPSVHEITNTTTEITGFLNDKHCIMVAEVDNSVYVPEDGGEDSYYSCNNYDGTKKVVPTEYSATEKAFCLEIPAKTAGKSIVLYSIDHVGRISAKQTKTVTEVAPNKPVIYQVSDADGYVFGKAKASGKQAKATVTYNGKTYSGEINTSGYFSIKVPGLKKDASLKVQASDVVDGTTRKSVKTKAFIQGHENLMEEKNYQNIKFTEINDKTEEIMGTVKMDSNEELYIRIGSKIACKADVDTDGSFIIVLDECLKAGTQVFGVIRYKNDSIDEVVEETVAKTVPDEPAYIDDITTKTDKIRVVSEKDCTVTVRVGKKKVYRQSKGVYSEKYDGYIYKVKVAAPKKNQKVYIRSANSAGKSKRIAIDVINIKSKKKTTPAEGDSAGGI